MYTLLARRDFRTFLAGQTLATLGDHAVFVALGVWVKDLTGSSSAAGLVLLAYTAPLLLLPVGGYLADRFPRRPVLLVANLSLVLGSLPLLTVDGPSDAWVIHAVAVGYGLASAVTGPALSAVLREIVSGEADLGAAAALSQSVRSAVMLLAPLLGASLLGWAGGRAFTLVNMALLLGAVAAFLLLRKDEAAARSRSPEPVDLLGGLRHLRASQDIRGLLTALTALTFVVGLLQPMLYTLIEDGLRRAPRFMGVLEAVLAVGSLAGSVTGGFLVGRLGPRRMVLTGAALFGAGATLLLVAELPVVLAGLVIAGAGIPTAVIGLATAAQAATPAHLMGRTQAVVNLALTVPQALSLGVGSALVAVLSFRQVTAVMVVGAAGCALLLARRSAHLAAAEAAPENTMPENAIPQNVIPENRE